MRSERQADGLLLEMGAIASRGGKVPAPTVEETADAYAHWPGWRRLGITTGHALEHEPHASIVYELYRG